MIKITHNFDKFAEELAAIPDNHIPHISKRAMHAALIAGRLKANQELGKVMLPIRGTRWPSFFKGKTKLSQSKRTGLDYEGHIWFSGHQHSLSSYATASKMNTHRKRANKHLSILKPTKTKKYAKPLEFKTMVGKTTRLKRTFAAKPKGRWMVFRRGRDGGKFKLNKKGEKIKNLSVPKGPSVAMQMRSRKDIARKTKVRMRIRYESEYTAQLKHRFRQAIKKANKKSL